MFKVKIIPIVFLHGFLGSPTDWDQIISRLPDYSSIAIELPGHGNTRFSPHLSLSKLNSFHLVGYSMGGRLAMAYAHHHPEKIASLTILSAHTGLEKEEEKRKRLLIDQKWAHKLLTLPIDEFLIEWYDQPIFQSFRPDFSMRKKHNPVELAKALTYYSLAHQPLYRPKGALFLVGEKDVKYRTLYRTLPHTVIPNAGHMIHLENPTAVAKRIYDHLAKSR